MKARFQVKFLCMYFGIYVADIVYLKQSAPAIAILIFIYLSLYFFLLLYLSRIIAPFKKNSLFYNCIFHLSLQKAKLATFCGLFGNYMSIAKKDTIGDYQEHSRLIRYKSIALKEFRFQEFLVKSHVLEVP